MLKIKFKTCTFQKINIKLPVQQSNKYKAPVTLRKKACSSTPGTLKVLLRAPTAMTSLSKLTVYPSLGWSTLSQWRTWFFMSKWVAYDRWKSPVCRKVVFLTGSMMDLQGETNIDETWKLQVWNSINIEQYFNFIFGLRYLWPNMSSFVYTSMHFKFCTA